MNYDFLFEFVDGAWEGEQILCEEATLADAWKTLCETLDFDKNDLKFICKLSVEEGEMMGLDTY